MTLFLTEREVAELLPMGECISALSEAFAHSDTGLTEIKPRSRMRMPGGFFHFMAAADQAHGVFGYKAYPSFAGPGGSKFIVMLYDYETGGLLACLEAGRLGQIRTGAATGLATDLMARKESATVGVIGSGFQARTQLEAICSVRDVTSARVFSRRAERREQFATRMSEQLNIPVTAASDAQSCVEGADVVVTITPSREPVLMGEWLSEGTHVNAAGSNHWQRREIDETTVTRSELIVVDELAGAKQECGDLLWPEARGAFRWDQVRELREVVSGRQPGRPNAGSITLFESMGTALEDIAAAQLVYRKAAAAGVGQQLPF